MSDSSPEADALIEADPAETAQQSGAATTADSSPADGGASLLDSVSEALNEANQEKSPISGQDQKPDPAVAQTAATTEEPLGEITDAELQRYGPKTQRRIKALLGERSERDRRIEQLSPKADSFDRIDTFVRENRITPDDLSVTLELAALIRNDPFKALDKVQAIMNGLAKVTGHELPPDVQERVRLGYLSEQDARDLVAARSKAAFTQAQSEEQQREAREARERQSVHSHVESCRDTANTWETAKKASDPDWNEKQSRIGQLIELEVYRNGYPKTKQEVVKMLDGFYSQVTQEYARFKPKPREVRPAIGSASSRATAQPKTLMEAVDAALAQ